LRCGESVARKSRQGRQRYKGDSNFNHGAWRAIWGLFGGVLVG
jgi:hypothetical protein